MILSTGTVLNNRYRIVKLVAQGGFGAVYRAWDLNLNRACAVKENFETSTQAQRQFEREASFLANLHHANLPRVIDHFTIPGQGQYLVMDFVEGDDLQELLDRTGRPLPESQVLRWIDQICDALSYLHAQKPPIIHRDIKPANIKIMPDDKAILVDFGIAKVFDPMIKTTQGAQAATPGFSPVEQYGQGTTDTRSDIYALGATLYTLLTGEIPVECIKRVVRDPLIPADQLNPRISPSVAATIHQSMQIDPDLRQQNIAEFKARLTTAPLISASISSHPAANQSSAPSYGIKAKRQSWVIWAGLSAAILFLIILGLWIFWNPPTWLTWLRTPTPTLVIEVRSSHTPEHTETEVGTENVYLTQTSRAFEEEISNSVASALYEINLSQTVVATLIAESPTPVATESSTITPIPKPTATQHPTETLSLILISDCPLRIGQEVHLLEDTRFWTKPNVIDSDYSPGTTGMRVYILEGPEWGRIRYDSSYSGWWWEVSSTKNGQSLGWVWEQRFAECSE